ncbi:response regulator [Ornithinibacillus bavariensis]|uniref:C4-dicarboxylate response regulator DctR n=1 Tax=Ornithinibacillus bavariensis TaxID=545502 RepID=A0A919X662_9BACI|nr:response regulator [Ornithinibacillus bavariensis]GIO26642.1 putative C4-dicarboxylate response regulator DctR [Ornithinibacillus bavariensis]
MSITILVVDDDENIRFTLKEICHYAEWNVLEAATGKDAVELFKQMRPDLVLLDYHLPHGDGISTTKTIRKRDQHVPIIVLTVDERQEVADSFMKAGATDFALKPIKAPDLISRIRLNLRISKLTEEHHSAFVDKGIKSDTLMSIKGHLLNQEDAVTIDEVKDALPIAYQTVHRYLNYLEGKGEVEVITQYGKKGRPKNRYRLI